MWGGGGGLCGGRGELDLGGEVGTCELRSGWQVLLRLLATCAATISANIQSLY